MNQVKEEMEQKHREKWGIKSNIKIWQEITCPYCKDKFLIQSCEGNPICPYCGKLIRKWAGEVWTDKEV